ncbi:hypothetical protein CONPUDRAFT_154453 [Coniophora puteana RWD-64-598 SS2]|uniref:Uncharacterized protein n=1 Tax=Coniophora puteana (strain RWD-64-598) TaxID=741705 RepID=A0A5M3MMJ2_CONPW|nr:uncharacterized protein CONPUDRAFT_154453 [Coniophora puteana RWD-64-598 SS2]EIW80422.1 hypothetical protein CONPUDRAFT_154453 [Coniophora puteana RWD-64-598 SS2]
MNQKHEDVHTPGVAASSSRKIVIVIVSERHKSEHCTQPSSHQRKQVIFLTEKPCLDDRRSRILSATPPFLASAARFRRFCGPRTVVGVDKGAMLAHAPSLRGMPKPDLEIMVLYDVLSHKA